MEDPGCVEKRELPRAGCLGQRAGAERGHFLVGSSRYVCVGAGHVMPPLSEPLLMLMA